MKTLSSARDTDDNYVLSKDSPAAYIDQPKARSTPRNLKRKVSESLEQSTKEQVEAFNAKKIKRGALKEVTEMPIDVLFEVR